MPKILLQEELPLKRLDMMKREFPQYTFVEKCESIQDWYDVEALYGQSLDCDQLAHAPRLKWVHCPTTDTDKLCLSTLESDRSDVLLSLGGRYNVTQIAEYVMGGILLFSKQFFKWTQAPSDPLEFSTWPLQKTMWTLQDKTLLQIGLGHVGSEIVRFADFMGMKVWGVRARRSFHPFCKKIFTPHELHSLLPHVDVISVAVQKQGMTKPLLGEEEFRLMKNDSIFVVTGSGEPIDETALVRAAQTGKFRGIIMDAFQKEPLPKRSPLRELQDIVLTPGVSGAPQLANEPALNLFLRNLRIYQTGRYQEMKNLVEI